MTTTSDRPTTSSVPAARTSRARAAAVPSVPADPAPTSPTSVDPSPPGPRTTGPSPSGRSPVGTPRPDPMPGGRGGAPAVDVTVLRLRRARDLIAYLPHRLGFRPHESLVVAGVDRDHRLGLVARVDLADLAGPCGHLLASDLVAHLLEDGAETVVAVVHTATDPREPDGRGGLRPVPGTLAVVAVDRFALAWEERSGEGRMEEWVVTPRGYLDLDCRDPECCPPGGSSMDDGSDDAVGRRLTAEGSVVAERRRDLGRIDLAPAGARRSADSARLRWADRLRRARRTCAAAVRPVGCPVADQAGADRPEVDVDLAAGLGADDIPVRPDAGATGRSAAAEHDCPVRRWRRDSLDLWTSTLLPAAASLPGSGRDAGNGGCDVVGVPPLGADPRRARGCGPASLGTDAHDPGAHASGARGVARGIAPRALGRLESALDDRLVRDAVLVSVLVPGSDLPARMIDAGGHDGSGVAGPRHDGQMLDEPWRDPQIPHGQNLGGQSPGKQSPGKQRPEGQKLDWQSTDGYEAGVAASGSPTGAPLAGALSTIFDPDRSRRPDPELTEAAVRVLQQVVAHGRVGHQAPALTLLALIAWWVGDGPRASVLAERALGDDPAYGLALLVSRLIDLGVPPGWLRPRP